MAELGEKMAEKGRGYTIPGSKQVAIWKKWLKAPCNQTSA
jgi:hypothetical protein